MNIHEYYIKSAVSKCGRYDKKLTQDEYYALLYYAPISGEIGRPARRALYEAGELRNRYPMDPCADNFSYVSYRDRNKETAYASYY